MRFSSKTSGPSNAPWLPRTGRWARAVTEAGRLAWKAGLAALKKAGADVGRRDAQSALLRDIIRGARRAELLSVLGEP